MSASLKIPTPMSVREFLTWDAPGPEMWQLVDGQPQAMAPANMIHGSIQNELGRIIANHLEASGKPCFVVTAPGVVPRVMSAANFRIPGLAVTCAPPGRNAVMEQPVLVIEILSPSNRAETWSNVWTYTSIPSVREILVVRTESMGVDLLCRDADGTWPDSPMAIKDGALVLESIGLRVALAALYRTTDFPSEAD
jgi:Uma2 family endonuclease